LYYAITGKVPFPGGTPKSKARRHLEETPWHPRRFNEDVSDDFVDLIGDMMEKNPKERIQSAMEVAERLAPWAADNCPLLSEDLASRPRWISGPIPSADNQDTDPNHDEVTEMAMNEMSDNSHSSVQASSQDLAGGNRVKPPPPLSVIGQYSGAGRLENDNSFSMAALFITAVVCLAIGILSGFIAGYLVSK
jgi:serine/threonine protein kinase